MTDEVYLSNDLWHQRESCALLDAQEVLKVSPVDVGSTPPCVCASKWARVSEIDSLLLPIETALSEGTIPARSLLVLKRHLLTRPSLLEGEFLTRYKEILGQLRNLPGRQVKYRDYLLGASLWKAAPFDDFITSRPLEDHSKKGLFFHGAGVQWAGPLNPLFDAFIESALELKDAWQHHRMTEGDVFTLLSALKPGGSWDAARVELLRDADYRGLHYGLLEVFERAFMLLKSRYQLLEDRVVLFDWHAAASAADRAAKTQPELTEIYSLFLDYDSIPVFGRYQEVMVAPWYMVASLSGSTDYYADDPVLDLGPAADSWREQAESFHIFLAGEGRNNATRQDLIKAFRDAAVL